MKEKLLAALSAFSALRPRWVVMVVIVAAALIWGVSLCSIASQIGGSFPGFFYTADRIISAFPEGSQENIRTQLASILRGVISQVLLPRASGRGRVAAFEIMVGTPAIGNLIRQNNTHQIPGALQTQAKFGMCTLDHSLAERVAHLACRHPHSAYLPL